MADVKILRINDTDHKVDEQNLGADDTDIRKLAFSYDTSRGISITSNIAYALHQTSTASNENVWIIVKATNASPPVVTYATNKNNTSITSKANAWSGRTGLTYASSLSGII